ncbi:MAG: hypothetical protein A2527_07460 [Candidatus Lambdaproteobacteria bacterium RIFOXYD2_FULL_50_16]|uniref:Uncharacterized protein n=1 Tax=Candidatus Lambdaproteobacteria bacterium RIFOXYD2_FULL_50_16 TaxID=1817772 RepID=A0A1F6GB74_9PROT|nr:MAG: hypothetical protein A2527_07460 [Candidatus Lambdaproteobacteria bacterium RIFOXYD2_FULL_50_16]
MAPYVRSLLVFLFFLGACAAPKPVPPKKPSLPPPEVAHPKETAYLKRTFESAKPFLRLLDLSDQQAIDFPTLKTRLLAEAKLQKLSRQEIKDGLFWLNYLENKAARIKMFYRVPGEKAELVTAKGFLQRGRAWMPPVMAAMWDHCQHRVEAGSRVHLNTLKGWQSPAYVAWEMGQSQSDLPTTLKKVGLPFYTNRHQQRPLIQASIGTIEGRGVAQRLAKRCGEFGFSLDQGKNIAFIGDELLYQPIFASAQLPPDLAQPLEQALHEAQFYPSPQGLKVILAMAFKESSLLWNPSVNEIKKKSLREQFHKVLGPTEVGWGRFLTGLMLDKKLEQEKEALTKRLLEITEPKSHATEYDVYLWSHQAAQLLDQLMDKYSSLAKLGSQALNLEARLRRLRYEPQTFGLWQVNINHLVEKLNQNPELSARFPEVFIKGQVDRHGLIASLSGLKKAPLNKTRTLTLIFLTKIKPRYLDHQQGHPHDLLFFAAENLTGELSTFRAAIQLRLSYKLKRPVSADGDLAFYKPYSLTIDWTHQSQTQWFLLRYALDNKKAWGKTSPKALVTQLCEAQLRSDLLKNPLYLRLMGPTAGERAFPQIKSELYSQGPRSYGRRVLALAEQF